MESGDLCRIKQQESNLWITEFNQNILPASLHNTVPFTLFIAGHKLSLAFRYKKPEISLDELFDSGCYLTHLMSGIIADSFEMRGIQLACRKNCKSTCCKHLIILSIPEALAVSIRLIRNHKGLIEKSTVSTTKISDSIPACDENICKTANPEEYINRWFENMNIRCPFLSKENHCLVYNDRPLICRYWLVLESPDHCRANRVTPGYRLQMPFNMTNILMRVGSALLGTAPHWISLHGLYDWYLGNRHLLHSKWPSEMVIELLLENLLREIKFNAAVNKPAHTTSKHKKSRLNSQPAFQTI